MRKVKPIANSSSIQVRIYIDLITGLFIVVKYILLIFTVLAHVVLADVDLVKVEKSTGEMYLYESGAIVRKYKVAFGKNPKGHKQQEGDEKTPEGNYTLDYKKENSSFYRAMHISYPNEQDKQKAKTLGVSAGGFIMVHGQRNGFSWFSPITQYFNWTNGCIALTNSEMDEFLKLVKVGTAIQISW
jgi:murein L,D-transpeptidase YafK